MRRQGYFVLAVFLIFVVLATLTTVSNASPLQQDTVPVDSTPARPNSLRAVDVGGNHVQFGWNYAGTEAQFEIQVYDVSTGQWTTAGISQDHETDHDGPGLFNYMSAQPNTGYSFRVRARGDTGIGSWSSTIYVHTGVANTPTPHTVWQNDEGTTVPKSRTLDHSINIVTVTPRPTKTPGPTHTPTRTPTNTRTPVPTATHDGTGTPPPTNTATTVPTPTKTNTPRPTATPQIHFKPTATPKPFDPADHIGKVCGQSWDAEDANGRRYRINWDGSRSYNINMYWKWSNGIVVCDG